MLERATISMSDDFAAELFEFMTANGYRNRSEAVRDLVRAGLQRGHSGGRANGKCLAILSYVYRPGSSQLARNLQTLQRANAALYMTTLRFLLENERCMEVVILCGDGEKLRALSQAIIAENGVSYADVSIVPAN